MFELYCGTCKNNLLLFYREPTADGEKFFLKCPNCGGILYEHEDIGEEIKKPPEEKLVN